MLTWLLAIYMLTSAHKGISSTRMARELGITQKSAWFLAQRIRETWLKSLDGEDGDIGNHVQVDETYVGGKEMNKHADKTLHAGRSAVGKTAVVGMRVEKGQIRAMPVANTKSTTLKGFIRENAPVGATVVTDQHKGYLGLAGEGFHHKLVNHLVGEYVRDMGIRPASLPCQEVATVG